jgi:hypothetical protein
MNLAAISATPVVLISRATVCSDWPGVKLVPENSDVSTVTVCTCSSVLER